MDVRQWKYCYWWLELFSSLHSTNQTFLLYTVGVYLRYQTGSQNYSYIINTLTVADACESIIYTWKVDEKKKRWANKRQTKNNHYQYQSNIPGLWTIISFVSNTVFLYYNQKPTITFLFVLFFLFCSFLFSMKLYYGCWHAIWIDLTASAWCWQMNHKFHLIPCFYCLFSLDCGVIFFIYIYIFYLEITNHIFFGNNYVLEFMHATLRTGNKTNRKRIRLHTNAHRTIGAEVPSWRAQYTPNIHNAQLHNR